MVKQYFDLIKVVQFEIDSGDQQKIAIVQDRCTNSLPFLIDL